MGCGMWMFDAFWDVGPPLALKEIAYLALLFGNVSHLESLNMSKLYPLAVLQEYSESPLQDIASP